MSIFSKHTLSQCSCTWCNLPRTDWQRISFSPPQWGHASDTARLPWCYLARRESSHVSDGNIKGGGGGVFIKSWRLSSLTCWVIERQAVIDDVILAHAEGKIPKSSDSVVTVTGTHKSISWQLWKVFYFIFEYRLWNVPTVDHNGGLGESRGARGVDIKQSICRRERNRALHLQTGVFTAFHSLVECHRWTRRKTEQKIKWEPKVFHGNTYILTVKQRIS